MHERHHLLSIEGSLPKKYFTPDANRFLQGGMNVPVEHILGDDYAAQMLQSSEPRNHQRLTNMNRRDDTGGFIQMDRRQIIVASDRKFGKGSRNFN